MTVLDRLLEIGNHRCPCGGTLDIVMYVDDPLCYGIRCNRCGSITGDENGQLLVETFTGWLVLTGGPISGEVPPPDTAQVSKAFKYRIDDPRPWWFYPGDRTPAIIRSWLESEVTT